MGPSRKEQQSRILLDFLSSPLMRKACGFFRVGSWDFYPGHRIWITFENPGGAYAPSRMVQAVVDRILAKMEEYEDRNLHVPHALDELHLLCYYCDDALLANTVPGTPRFDFAAMASRVAEALAHDHPVFNRILLYHPHQARKVLQVYPAGVGKGGSMPRAEPEGSSGPIATLSHNFRIADYPAARASNEYSVTCGAAICRSSRIQTRNELTCLRTTGCPPQPSHKPVRAQ